MSGLVQGAAAWLVNTLLGALFGAAGVVYDALGWVVDKAVAAFHLVFNELWAWAAAWLIDKVAALLGGWTLPVAPDGALAYVATGARAMNWIFPMDMIILALPAWAAFEVGCFMVKLFRVAVWG